LFHASFPVNGLLMRSLFLVSRLTPFRVVSPPFSSEVDCRLPRDGARPSHSPLRVLSFSFEEKKVVSPPWAGTICVIASYQSDGELFRFLPLIRPYSLFPMPDACTQWGRFVVAIDPPLFSASLFPLESKDSFRF